MKKDEPLFRVITFVECMSEHMTDIQIERKRRVGFREFAKDVGTSPATLNRVARGNMPDLETFFKICKWMDESPNIFMRGN